MTSAPSTTAETAPLAEIEIFRAGTFVSTEGDTLSFGVSDLKAIADAYDPALFDAPLVIGHPAMDAPAYGWTKSLSVKGDRLVAHVGDVAADFAELVNAKRFKKISPRFWPAGHPSNPKPSGSYLAHVGFLGAHAPAVKGLRDASFSDADQQGCTTFETDFHNPQQEPSMPNETDKPKEQSFADREAALATREAAVAEAEKDLRLKREADLHAAHMSFAETQCAAGRVAPAGKAALVFVLDALATAPATMSFGEGDGAKPPALVLQEMIGAAAPLISFGEVAKPAASASTRTASFAAPSGHMIDPVALEVHENALQLQRAEPGLSYLDAVKRVS